MTTLYLVRHGLVENPTDVYYGRLSGFGLAATGREQAAAAGRFLAGRPITTIYHSPMQRAVETAAILRAHHPASPPLVESALLNEIHSPYDGLPVAEMERRQWDFYSQISAPYDSPTDVQARMLAFFDQVRQRHVGQHVVGVSHGDPIAFAILWAFGRPATAEQKQFLRECGVAGGYPVRASVSTFSWPDDASDPRPDFSYYAPEGAM
jgi:broad specificity phosphatase PhoE